MVGPFGLIPDGSADHRVSIGHNMDVLLVVLDVHWFIVAVVTVLVQVERFFFVGTVFLSDGEGDVVVHISDVLHHEVGIDQCWFGDCFRVELMQFEGGLDCLGF